MQKPSQKLGKTITIEEFKAKLGQILDEFHTTLYEKDVSCFDETKTHLQNNLGQD